jgi:hypothetical protein
MTLSPLTVSTQVGVTLKACLFDGCLVRTQLGERPWSLPQDPRMINVQLDSNLFLSTEQKIEFLEGLKLVGHAEIFLPRSTSKFFAG